ncbi:HDIG domain-containing metalloprotein [Clostridium sp. JN-9]|uniref:HDIG domain-containing metalloprotein n=1 Tax=Clostridium sp. JN-9 TaxID=2507159 RepID=UPI0026C0A8AD
MNKMDYFYEFNNVLLNETTPSVYFKSIAGSEIFTSLYPFTMLGKLQITDQSPKYHPEGSVWNHTLMVIDQCAERKDESSNKDAFMWAALLHDIGKPPTTKIRNGKITSYDHDIVGSRMAVEFLNEFNLEQKFIEKVTAFVRWHMQVLFVSKGMPFSDVEKMQKDIPIEEIALFALCDRLGRGNMTTEKIKEEEDNILLFIKKVKGNKVKYDKIKIKS